MKASQFLCRSTELVLLQVQKLPCRNKSYCCGTYNMNVAVIIAAIKIVILVQ